MSFTNDDKKYIKDTVSECVDNLAHIVARGFELTATKEDIKQLDIRIDHLDDRMDHLDGRIDHLDGEVQHINATLNVMSQDIADIKKHFVYRYEFEDLMARVKYLEKKLNIDSGK